VATGVEEAFRGLDLRVKRALADERLPVRAGLAALKIAHDEANADYLSIAELAAAMRAADVSISEESLRRAISRAGNKVMPRRESGVTKYRLAIPGRAVADDVLGASELTVLHIDGTTPRTDRRDLGRLLADLRGDVRVCDPYYGVRSLETLELFPTTSAVQLLTSRTTESQAKLAGPLKDFRKERPSVEIRLAPPGDVHDRYVLTDRRILIVGHGLKDVGTKESFVVALDRVLAPDLLDSVRRSFDEKWQTATPLS
jgi:hypothetical protein